VTTSLDDLARAWNALYRGNPRVPYAGFDAALIMLAAAALDGPPARISHRGHADIPPWLMEGLVATLKAWLTGKARTCRHDPMPDRPSPVFGAAWRPGMVTCPPCAALLGGRDNTVEGMTCDKCARVVSGVEHGDGIHPSVVQVGLLLYQFGVCGPCRQAEVNGEGGAP